MGDEKRPGEEHWHPEIQKRFKKTDELYIKILDKDACFIEVHTRHDIYEIVLLNPEINKIAIKGGEAFPSPTVCKISGSTMFYGGSMIKLHRIVVGWFMELHLENGMMFNSSEIQTIKFGPDKERVQKFLNEFN